MRELAVVLGCVLAVAGLAGCIGGEDTPTQPAPTNATNASTTAIPDEPTVALTECECFEPSAAWAPGGDLLATDRRGEAIARSTDRGRTFETIDPPERPEGVSGLGDTLLQVGPNGSVWWSALARDDTVPDIAGNPVQVARSDDGGETWTVNHVLSMSMLGEPSGATEASDRQWLAFGPDGQVYLVCNCPAGTTQMRVSSDVGETWSSPTQIPTLPRAGPVGKPAVTPNGTIVVPYLTGPPNTALPQLVRVGVSVSQDGGDSWTTKNVWVEAGPGDSASCCNFPNAAATSDGAVHVGWRTTSSDQALVASSTDDGSTWNPPVDWSKQGADPAGPSGLWLEPLEGSRLVATWFERTDNGTVNAVAATGTTDGVEERYTLGESQVETDHPHAAVSPDGLLAVPFVDADENVSVRVLEQPREGAGS